PSHQRARAARDRPRRRVVADATVALSGPRDRARASGDAGAAAAGARRPAAAGHAVLSAAVGDGAAGVLGSARWREAARARGRGRGQAARILPPGRPMTGREAADRRRALVCVAPTVVALGTLTVYPGIWVLWLSLQRRIPIFDVSRFAGFENYAFLAV